MDLDSLKEASFTITILPRQISADKKTDPEYEYGDKPGDTYEDLVDVHPKDGGDDLERGKDYEIIVKKDGTEIDPGDIGEPGEYEVIVRPKDSPNNEMDPDADDHFKFIIKPPAPNNTNTPTPAPTPTPSNNGNDQATPTPTPGNNGKGLGNPTPTPSGFGGDSGDPGDESHDDDHILDELGKDPDFPLSLIPPASVDKAQARANEAGDGILWLTYHEDQQIGWTVFEDINTIALLSDASSSHTILKAIDVTPFLSAPRDLTKDMLIVIPGESGEVMMAAVWDKTTGKTTQNMLLIDTENMELITMLRTQNSQWFDLSLNGLFSSFLSKGILVTIDIERALVVKDAQNDDMVVAYMLDEHLLEYVSSITATLLNTTTFAHYTDHFQWDSYPLAQATNNEVLVRITEGENTGAHYLTADNADQTVLQERYLLTPKEEKKAFYRWLQGQPRESKISMFATISAH